MKKNNTTGLKADDRPAVVHLLNGSRIDADHHFAGKNGALVHVVIDRDETPTGIDISIPIERIAAIQRDDRDAVARAARATLDVDPRDGTPVEVTAGGDD